MKTLKIALKQFAPSVIVMKRLHKETKLADMQYLWEIYLPAMHAKRYQSWTKLLLQKVHPVKWTCNRYVMLQLFLNTFMLTEVAILNLTFFLCLICVHKFYPSKFFSGCKKVCLVTCSTVYLCKEIQGIWCFRVDVKTPFAKLSIFFFWWLHVHRRYWEKKKKIPKNWPILPSSSLDNKLSIHLGEDKTKRILLKKGKKQYPSLSITRNESKTKQYSAVEYLGYFLDDNIGTYHTLWVLCNSLIHGSHFDFACCAWYPHLLMSLKNKLQTAQNACIRFCLGMERRSYIGLSMSRIALINTLQWRLTVLKITSLLYICQIYIL